MTPAVFIETCTALGVTVLVDDGRLKLRGPREAVAQVLPMVKPIKAWVIEHLTWPRPDPMAQLGHCLRGRPDTMATEDQRQALIERCKGLPDDGAVDVLLLQLFGYWRKETAPSLAAFLAATARRATA